MQDGNFIYEIEGVISSKLCEEIIKMFEDEPVKFQGRIGTANGYIIDLERRNSKNIIISKLEGWDYINKILTEVVNNAVNMYINEFCNYFKKYGEDPKFIYNSCFGPKHIEHDNFVVNRTEPNSHFRWHSDRGPEYFHTGIIYLNDLDIEDGGSTEFACGRKIQPKAGKLLLFPATWSNMHRGSFVRKHKYMITFNTYLIDKDCGIPFLIHK